MSNRQLKAGRNRGPLNQLSAQDQELISKAMNLAVKTLCKRMDKLSDKDKILFATKLAPYGWPEGTAANNSADNNNSVESPAPGSNNPQNASCKSKQKNGRAKGSQKQSGTDDPDIILKALRLSVNSLYKRIDRLSDKDLILFSALLARYKCIPDCDDDEIRWVSIGTAA